MKNKLFYTDPYQKEFTAEILNQNRDEQNRWYVELSKTAFYPTGGGQPHDTGTINGITVYDVEEMNGEIRHYIERPIPINVHDVIGKVDFERRFDHMQQHAGQHILSASFEQLFQYKTTSFHLGKEICTIDLDTEKLREEEIEAAEKLSNDIIFENRPISCQWYTEAEAKKMPLRKELAVKEDVRLVIIPDFDYNGCGGTHPDRTGQVTAIKILGWERQKKRVRLEFICGNRIMHQLGMKNSILKKLTSIMNSPEAKLTIKLEKMMEDRKQLEKRLEETNEKITFLEAKEIIGNSSEPLIAKVFQNRSIQSLQKLAHYLISESEGKIVILVAENGDSLQLVAAKGKEAPEKMNELLASVFPFIKGKGGGNEFKAQGGGQMLLSGEEVIELLRKSVRKEKN